MKSPFNSDIEEFGATLRSSPKELPIPTDMPREVIFFARVMQCLRRCCEVLGTDISALDRWAPVARKGLRDIVYNDPIPRGIRTGGKDKDEEEDEDDSGTFAPSRMLVMSDTAHFEVVTKWIDWMQRHPEVGDSGLEWLARATRQYPKQVFYWAEYAAARREKAEKAVVFVCTHKNAVFACLLLWVWLTLLGLKSLVLGVVGLFF